MRVLITGGSGFLGGAIISRLLDAGLDVRVFDVAGKTDSFASHAGERARKLEWRIGDVTDLADVVGAAEGCEAIVHLAGVLTPFCRQDPIAGAKINVLGTLHVFEAARRHAIKKVVYSSSGGVFGPAHADTPFPTTHYGAFKLANEGSARAYWEDHRIASVGFRPFVVYGPGRESGLSAGPTLACRAAAWDEPYCIPLTGTIGLVYVDDVAKAFDAAARTAFEGAHVFNLPGTPVEIPTIIDAIRTIEPSARLRCDGAPLPSIATAKDEYFNGLLRMPPATSLEEGLRSTIAHYRSTKAKRREPPAR
jgi:nucleoside-diphosphate-sugar epimerase